MGTALPYFKVAVFVNAEDYPVFLVNLHTPETAQIALERLRLADTVVTIAFDVLQQLVDAPEGLPVLCLSVEVIIPGVIVPEFSHAPTR